MIAWFRFRFVRLFALMALAAAAGCHRNAQESGPTLHFADQLFSQQAVLAAAHEDKPRDYRIVWSNFISGPPIIAAETGGSVDLGFMAETPLVFAQAAGSPVKVVAVSRLTQPGSSNIALVVRADSPIKTIADLRGRKVGYIEGTVAQYFMVRALAQAGLSLKDITTVRVDSYNPAILRGTLDALVTVEPLLSEALSKKDVRVVSYGGEPYTPGFYYLVASEKALADPKKAALIGDVIQRLARATLWTYAHVQEAAPFIASAYKAEPAIAEAILRRTPRHFVPADATVIAAQQQEADQFFKLGLIQHKVDAAQLFDHRYDTLLATLATAEAKP